MGSGLVERWLRLAGGPLAALAGFLASIAATYAWLKPALAKALGSEMATAASITLSAAAGLLMLWTARRVLVTRSKLLRPEKFDLRVRDRGDLLGRDQDIDDLTGLLDRHSLVFLDGESGSGKSSLVQHGLSVGFFRPRQMLPVLISDYGVDWDWGLAERVHRAVWASLSESDLLALGQPREPVFDRHDPDSLAALLEAVHRQLGLRPVLIFDQFDDYQLANREKLTSGLRAWISPRELRAVNHFWRVIDDLRESGVVRLLVVTRSDATPGLHSVRFTPDHAARSLMRLEGLWLRRLIGMTTEAEEGRAVVENPDDGWRLLQDILEQDLSRSGSILPQQVRIAFLGLRGLKALTPGFYRSAGGVGGLEARYLRTAIEHASISAQLSAATVRDLLESLVDRGSGETPKTRWRSGGDLEQIVPNSDRLGIALRQLGREEIVRAVGDGNAVLGWQLDHDYLARAVILEQQNANRRAARLRDAEDRWREAGANWPARFSRLLPLSTQLALLCARVWPKGSFRYGEHRAYAAFSSLRILPLLFIAGLSWAGVQEINLRWHARAAVDGLGGIENFRSVVELWGAPRAVRERAAVLILDSSALIEGTNPYWTDAYISLDPTRSRRLTDQVLKRLRRDSKLSDEARARLVSMLGLIAIRADRETCRIIAGDLADRVSLQNVGAKERTAAGEMLEFFGPVLDDPGRRAMRQKLEASPGFSKLEAETREKIIEGLAEEPVQKTLLGVAAVTAYLDAFDYRDSSGSEFWSDAAGQASTLTSVEARAAVLRTFDYRDRNEWRPTHRLDALLLARLNREDAAAVAVEILRRSPSPTEDWTMGWPSLVEPLASSLDQGLADSLASRLRRRIARENPVGQEIQEDYLALASLSQAVSFGEARATLRFIKAMPHQAPSSWKVDGSEPWHGRNTALLSYAAILGGDDAQAVYQAVMKDENTFGPKGWEEAVEAAAPRLPVVWLRRYSVLLTNRLSSEDYSSAEEAVVALGEIAVHLPVGEGEALLAGLEDKLEPFSNDRAVWTAFLDARVPLAAARLRAGVGDRESQIHALLMSVAVPMRYRGNSPAWKVLDEISGQRFGGEVLPLSRWTNDAVGAKVAEGRPVRPSESSLIAFW